MLSSHIIKEALALHFDLVLEESSDLGAGLGLFSLSGMFNFYLSISMALWLGKHRVAGRNRNMIMLARLQLRTRTLDSILTLSRLMLLVVLQVNCT